jgi:hypothetical protein
MPALFAGSLHQTSSRASLLDRGTSPSIRIHHRLQQCAQIITGFFSSFIIILFLKNIPLLTLKLHRTYLLPHA